MHNNKNQGSQFGRRNFLQATSGVALSGTAIALMSGCATAGSSDSNSQLEQDVRILNTAIADEHEAVAAYQLARISHQLVR